MIGLKQRSLRKTQIVLCSRRSNMPSGWSSILVKWQDQSCSVELCMLSCEGEISITSCAAFGTALEIEECSSMRTSLVERSKCTLNPSVGRAYYVGVADRPSISVHAW